MLQSSLKSGHKAGPRAGQKPVHESPGGQAALLALLALPALLDARTETRIEQLLTRSVKEGR